MPVNVNLTSEEFQGSIRKNGFVVDHNRFYNNGHAGGISGCINGKPTRNGANVLCNCVGFAWGAYNETWSKGQPDTWRGFTFVRGDAKNILNNAKKDKRLSPYVLPPGAYPPLGGLVFWGGNANHVAYISDVIDNNTITIIESGYTTPKWTVRNTANTGWCNNTVPNVSRGKNWGYRGTVLGFLSNPGATTLVNPGDNPANISSITQLSKTQIRVVGKSNGVSGTTTGSIVYYKWDSNGVSDSDYSGYVQVGLDFDIIITKPHEADNVAICPYQLNNDGNTYRGILSVADLIASIPCIYTTVNGQRRQGIPFVYTQGVWKRGVPLLYTNGIWNEIYVNKE